MNYKINVITDSGKPKEKDNYFHVHLSNHLENITLSFIDKCSKCGKRKKGRLYLTDKWEHICDDCMKR